LSNDNILWERVPTALNDVDYIHQRNCVYSADGNYIIAIHREWLSVYDSQTGAPVNKRYFDPLLEDPWNNTGIDKIYTHKDSNIIACRYWDTLQSYLVYYEIPSLNILGRKQMIAPLLSSDFEHATRSNYPFNNYFTVFDMNTFEIIYTDSAYNSNKDQESKKVDYLKYSLDNNFIIAIVFNEQIINLSIFDLIKKEMTSHYDIHPNEFDLEINSIKISDDFRYIIFTNEFGIYIFDLFAGNKISEIKHIQNTTSGNYSAISNNNKYIASINFHSEITLYEMETGSLTSNFHCLDNIIDLPGVNYKGDFIYDQQFSPDNSKLLVCGMESYYLFDIFNGELISLFSTHHNDLLEEPGIVMFANNDEYLLTIGPDKTIIWDAKTGRFIKALNLSRNSEQSNTVAISPDSKCLVYDDYDKIYFYDFVKEELVKEINPDNNVLQLSVSVDCKYLGYTMADSSFAVYDLETDSVIFNKSIKLGDKDELYGIYLSGNLNICFVIVAHGEIINMNVYGGHTYNFIDKKKLGFFYGHPKKIVFFDNDYKLLSLELYHEKVVDLYHYVEDDASFGQPIKNFNTGFIYDFKIAPNEKYFITSGPVIWNIETGDSVQLHADPEFGDMDYVAISDSGKMLAAISPEGRIIVWNVEQYLTPVEDYDRTKEQFSFSCYPNPADQEIRIKINTAEYGEHNIYIYNAQGIELAHISWLGGLVSKDINIDVSGYPSGLYFVKVQTGMFAEVVKALVVH